ncbi:hypothetical protein CY652_13240 [Burkholderia sp. WAC0059]|nr:hypothetical protein CY652_13240 [Burkholderia sp. WAC0059]
MGKTLDVRIESNVSEDEKKKRAWSPLKTTRYGVSARRPMKEPGSDTVRRVRLQQGCPCEGLRLEADRPMCCVRSHLHQATSVLKPLKALWAN